MKLFRKLFQRKIASGHFAKDRLKVLLVSDRVGCSPDALDMMKEELIHVISKYMDIKTEDVELKIMQTTASGTGEEGSVLFAHIPIKEMRHA